MTRVDRASLVAAIAMIGIVSSLATANAQSAEAEVLLAAMDDVYALLVTVDYPDALTGGLRRTTDALRPVLERTRGDLTTTFLQQRLQQALEQRLPE